MDNIVTKVSSKDIRLGSLMPKKGIVSNEPISNEIFDDVSSKSTLFNNSIESAEESVETSIKGLSWSFIAKIFIVLFILAFLGFNLFNYLGKATSDITEIFRPLIKFFGITTGETIKELTDTTATGMKGTIDVASGTIDTTIDMLEKGIDGNSKINRIKKDNLDDLDITNDNDDTHINHPEPDKSGSRTQNYKANGKSGFCYIGEDRGFRSCIKIGKHDKCISGDIFPTKDLCINPNLRE